MSGLNNRLAVLAAEIVTAHREAVAASETAVMRAADAGRYLIEAKASLPHGEWLPWLRRHVGFSVRTAQGYIRLAQLAPKDAQRVAHLGVRRALQEIRAAGELAIQGESARAKRRLEFARLWTSATAPERLGFLKYLQRMGQFRQTTEEERQQIIMRGVLRDLKEPGWFIRAAVVENQQ